jgi:hypothetical protein
MSAPIRVCLGIRGYGKTTAARALSRDAPRLLAFDPFGEHDALRMTMIEAAHYLAQLDRDRQLNAFRVGVYPYDGDEPRALAVLAWEVALRCGGLTLVLEEADQIAPVTGMSPDVARTISQGRHLNIEIIGTTRRPAEVTRLLTANADEYFVFRIQEPTDLTYLRSVLGPEAVLVVNRLEKFECVFWTPSGWREGAVTANGVLTWRNGSPRAIERAAPEPNEGLDNPPPPEV